MSLKAASFHVNGLYYLDQKAPPLSSESPFVGKVSEIWHAAFPRKTLSADLPASTQRLSLQACVCGVCVCVYLRALGWLHANLPHCFRVTAFAVFKNKAFLHKPYAQLFYVYFEAHHPIFIATILGDHRAALSPCKAVDYRQGLAGYQKTPLSFKNILQMLEDLGLDQHHVALLSLWVRRWGGKYF